MAGAGGRGAARAPIPAAARRVVKEIRDFGCNHADDEIYAALCEAGMDPNEAARKLLMQDTFHEVKRKREKRKENVRETAEPRWRPGVLGRGGRGGRPSHGASSDNSVRKVVTSAKENGGNQGTDPDKGDKSSPIMSVTERKLTSSKTSAASGIANGPSNMEKEMPSQSSKEENSTFEIRKGSSKQISNNVKVVPRYKNSVSRSDNFSSTKTSASVLGVYASTLVVPPRDSPSTSEISTIRHVVGSQRATTDAFTKPASRDALSGSEFSSTSGKGSHDVSNSQKGNKSSDASQVSSLSSTANPGSRPSSNYNNRSQQLNSSQKVVSNKEWKPKPTPTISAQVPAGLGTSNVPVVVEAVDQQLPAEPATSEETISKVEKKLDALQLAEKHVIIPSHIQVPETEIQRLNFGSFGSSFKVNTGLANGSEVDKSVPLQSDTSQEIDENVEQLSSSVESPPPVVDEGYPDRPPSSDPMPENNSSTEAGMPDASSGEDHDQGKQETDLGPDGPQFSVVHTAPSYSTFGLVPHMPHMLGSHFAPLESSESQPRDSSRSPSFVVQQPFDPVGSYYAQFYRPTADSDGRFSPFPAPSGSKFNGNVAVLPVQAGQSPQETGSPVVLSTAGSTPHTAQAVGAIQSSIAVPQHPVPVFRQPGAGLHLSHYPPSYVPYGQYYSPFFVPPPLHHFLATSQFPQQPPSGNVFPPPGAAAAAPPVKYSVAPYKPGSIPGNSTIVGMNSGFGNYNSSPAGYASNPNASNNGNSTGNEDLNSSQFKENNAYISGQQSEASSVWIPFPGRDMTGLQPSSFYSIPPQGQHVTFAPSQAAHGAFNNIYHPAPTVATAAVHPLLQPSQTGAGGAVEVVGPPSGMYQPPQQRSPINWTNNY